MYQIVVRNYDLIITVESDFGTVRSAFTKLMKILKSKSQDETYYQGYIIATGNSDYCFKASTDSDDPYFYKNIFKRIKFLDK